MRTKIYFFILLMFFTGCGVNIEQTTPSSRMDRFVESYASCYGISKSESRSIVNTFYTFQVNAGISPEEASKSAVELSKRAYDLASYHGQSPTFVANQILLSLKGY